MPKAKDFYDYTIKELLSLWESYCSISPIQKERDRIDMSIQLAKLHQLLEEAKSYESA